MNLGDGKNKTKRTRVQFQGRVFKNETSSSGCLLSLEKNENWIELEDVGYFWRTSFERDAAKLIQGD